jgi:two-component system, chemotaxis family, sensor kinase CheA
MSIDMIQFHAVFFEESQEHLENMEQLLLALDVDSPDFEELNSIFRAAHSIKGGSGIFGFDALGKVTHILENLLDSIRQGKRDINPSLVDLFLNAVDVLKNILNAYRTSSDIDWDQANAICAELKTANEEESVANKVEKKQEIVEDADFGFFDDAPAVKKETAKKQDDTFGFFDDEPQAVVPLVKPSVASPVDKAAAKPKVAETNVESSSIRVDVTKVDQLINLVGEIVITQSMMNLVGKDIDGTLGEKFQSIAAELERNTREIQEAVMSIRMLPISFVFNRFPRVVRDLSQKLGKSIDLIIEGGETELDKGLIERLVDPLTHLVRNSLDHGIESAEVRSAMGKSTTGKVILRAAQQGGSIVITIIDDGGGLNRAKILAKAQEKGISISDNPSDAEVWQLIFAPGFSTAAQITDVSGRGVGLDVVTRNVQSLGGRIDIESAEGKGTTFSIRLPLTLAIVDGMCVSVGDQTFIIPLVNIVESMRPLQKDIKTLVGDDQLLFVRDEYWPILPLYKAMQISPNQIDPSKGIVVLLEANKHHFALFVDGLVGQQQVVIKSLEQHYKRIQGVAGATIMGDGSVALILDVESLSLNCNPDLVALANKPEELKAAS